MSVPLLPRINQYLKSANKFTPFEGFNETIARDIHGLTTLRPLAGNDVCSCQASQGVPMNLSSIKTLAVRASVSKFAAFACASIVFLAFIPTTANADHIFGVFTGPGNNTITVKQRGKQVTGTLRYRGQNLRVTGWSDGGDYVRGQITGKTMSGTFEMLYQGTPQPALEVILYQGQFGAPFDQGRFIRTKVIPHSHARKKAKPGQDKSSESSGDKATETARPKRQLPYATPQNELKRKLPYQ